LKELALSKSFTLHYFLGNTILNIIQKKIAQRSTVKSDRISRCLIRVLQPGFDDFAGCVMAYRSPLVFHFVLLKMLDRRPLQR
jgi:hypothetical protein